MTVSTQQVPALPKMAREEESECDRKNRKLIKLASDLSSYIREDEKPAMVKRQHTASTIAPSSPSRSVSFDQDLKEAIDWGAVTEWDNEWRR